MTGRPAENEPEAVVSAFNRCINGRDLEGLVALMAEDHTLIDSARRTITGKKACRGAWEAFFRQFPDYRNIFERMVTRGHRVAVVGRAVSSDPRLHGPALWSATVIEGRVAEWRVWEDTRANRVRLGLTRGEEPVD